MVTNACGMMPPQYLRSAYINQVGLSDMCDDTFMGTSPMGMNGSLFGGCGYGMGYGMGMGYGYGPGSEVMNMSQADYLKYSDQLRDMQFDSRLNLHKKMEATDYAMSSPQDKVTAKASVLQMAIRQNNQDHVGAAFTDLQEAVKEKLKEINPGLTEEEMDKTIKSQTAKAYTEATGENLRQALQTNGDSEFIHGMKQGTGIGYFLTNEKNYKDNLYDITGEQVTTADKAQRWLGVGLGAVLTAVAARLLFRHGPRLTHALGNAQKGIKLSLADASISRSESKIANLASKGYDTSELSSRLDGTKIARDGFVESKVRNDIDFEHRMIDKNL